MWIRNLLIFFMLSLYSCYSRKPPVSIEQSREDPSVIDLSDALEHIVDKVNLSEFVDSIEYIPLETTSASLLKGGCVNTGDYLVSFNKCFDKDGNFLFTLGKKGQGVFEDIYAEYANVIFLSGHFYACSQKTIEYDINGKCTGKVRNNYTYRLKQQETEPIEGRDVTTFAKAGKNIMCFYFPDSIVFYDTAYVCQACSSIMKWDWEKYPRPHHVSQGYNAQATSYRDTTLFYFYYCDTVYTVHNTSLKKRWIIKMKEKQHIPIDYIGQYDELHREPFLMWKNGGGNYGDTKIARMVDNAFMINSFYETDRYIFMPIRQMIGLWKFRNVHEPESYIGIYDKQTRRILVTRELVNDVDGIRAAFHKGVSATDNYLTCCLWPYELMEDINPSLPSHQVLTRLKQEDNPVYIKAHLKK